MLWKFQKVTLCHSKRESPDNVIQNFDAKTARVTATKVTLEEPPIKVSFCTCMWNTDSKRSFFLNFGPLQSILWGYWYSCFKLLVVSALGFRTRMDPSLACFTSRVTPLGNQHGGQDIFFIPTYLTQALVGVEHRIERAAAQYVTASDLILTVLLSPKQRCLSLFLFPEFKDKGLMYHRASGPHEFSSPQPLHFDSLLFTSHSCLHLRLPYLSNLNMIPLFQQHWLRFNAVGPHRQKPCFQICLQKRFEHWVSGRDSFSPGIFSCIDLSEWFYLGILA